jgi:hypothetical protein
MGNGRVVGAAMQGKGFLDVKFGRDDVFAIRASNLVKVSDCVEVEPESGMEQRGLKLGDAIVWLNHTRGIVEDKAPLAGHVMVRFGGIGVRRVRTEELTKVMLNYEVEKGATMKEIQRAKEQAATKWAQVAVERKKVGSVHFDKSAQNNFLQVGSPVRSKVKPWKGMGLGFVQEFGDEPGTVHVLFSIQGEAWLMNCDDLQQVEDPGYCKFKDTVRTNFQEKQKTVISEDHARKLASLKRLKLSAD